MEVEFINYDLWQFYKLEMKTNWWPITFQEIIMFYQFKGRVILEREVYKAEVVVYYNVSSYRKLPGIMNAIYPYTTWHCQEAMIILGNDKK